MKEIYVENMIDNVKYNYRIPNGTIPVSKIKITFQKNEIINNNDCLITIDKTNLSKANCTQIILYIIKKIYDDFKVQNKTIPSAKISISIDENNQFEIDIKEELAKLGIDILEFETKQAKEKKENNNQEEVKQILENIFEIRFLDNSIISIKESAYNNGMVMRITPQELYHEYQEITNDPFQKDRLSKMTKEERTNELIQMINAKTTKYESEYTQSRRDSNKNDKNSEIVNNTSSADDKVATNMGVIINDPNSNKSYEAMVVKSNDDGTKKIVGADVKNVNVTSNGPLVQNDYTMDAYSEKVTQIDQEEIKDVYLEDREIKNIDGETIGILGYNGYDIDIENNQVIKRENGNIIIIGNISSKEDLLNNSRTKNKPKIKTLEKKEAAFINMKVIIAIIVIFLIAMLILILILSSNNTINLNNIDSKHKIKVII